MPDDRTVLHEFKRNAEETLRVSLSVFKGKTYVDFRLFYEDANGELAPTKKGVTVTPELWDEFRAGVAAAEQTLQEKNLWHPADQSDSRK
ncbi:MAG TPA: transcriptional coactivator p15/PC4 family protein [Thermoanaerobaculaceae bacterium]|nr:transcriptional coactivator p15/PC4 family protein [Thermoanaerobaculaceae bacterium]